MEEVWCVSDGVANGTLTCNSAFLAALAVLAHRRSRQG